LALLFSIEDAAIVRAKARIGPAGVIDCDDRRAASRRAFVVVLCALGAIPALLPCEADARSDSIIWEGEDQSVVLVQQDEDTAPPNDHPVTMAPEEIERMLSGLRFSHSDRESAAPMAVFTHGQVEILGQALSTGLARATPSEDVIFSIIGAHQMSPGAFARRNRLTAGRAFFRNGTLNVIFGEIQSPYRKKNIYGNLDEDFSPREHGSRASPEAQEAVLVASTEVSLLTDQQGQRGDWVVFVPTGTNPARRPADEVPPAEPVPPAAASSPAADPATDSADVANDDIERRLETLKRLREKGLISEDVYREKVDEVLNDL
jgi:hypothetical protein